MQFSLEDIAGDVELLRFLGKLKIGGDGCWNWTGSLTAGYGSLWVPSRQQFVGAHRYSFERFKEPIPEGMVIDHVCRNRACVNPEHLEAVTPRENVMRADTFAARQAAQTHCKRGHLLSGENLYRHPDGSRQCRTCRSARDRRSARPESLPPRR